MYMHEDPMSRNMRMMAIYLRYVESWELLGLKKHHVFVPPDITAKSLLQSRRLICKKKLDSECGYWDQEGDYRDDSEDACKNCNNPLISNSELSEMLWGVGKDGLVVDVSSLRRYLRGGAMKFDRYRQAIRSLYDNGYWAEHIAVAEWERLIDLEAFANLLVESERKLRTSVSDHREFLCGFSAWRITISQIFGADGDMKNKTDVMRRRLFSERDFQCEVDKVRARLASRVEASNRQAKLARLADALR